MKKKKKQNTIYKVGIIPHYVASNEKRAQGLTRGAEAIKGMGKRTHMMGEVCGVLLET